MWREPVSGSYRTLPEIFGRVLRPYRTLLNTSVGYLPSTYLRYIYFDTYATEHTLGRLCTSIHEIMVVLTEVSEPEIPYTWYVNLGSLIITKSQNVSVWLTSKLLEALQMFFTT